MRYPTVTLLSLGLALGIPFAVHADVQGYWLSEEGTAQIELAPCEEGSEVICGRIVWLEEPRGDDGEPLRDTNNDDPDLRDREILGLQMLRDMEPDDSRDRRWGGGRIYDPESGNTYRARMDLSEDGDELDLRGYVGMAAFGRTSTWTREKERREVED